MHRYMNTSGVRQAIRDFLSRPLSRIQEAVSMEMKCPEKRPMHMKRRKEHPTVKAGMGFTFIELLIVMVILGIAAAIAVPMMSSAASMQIRAAGTMVAADLEYAKSMAISRGQQYLVVFDAANETYEIQDSGGNVISHPVKKGFSYEVDFANDGRLDRVDIVSANFDGETTIGFDYLGSPYSVVGGTSSDLNSGTITLQAGSVTKTVSIEAVTGFITVSN